MTSHRSPTVVLVSVPGTLRGVDPLLRVAGVRPVRIVASEPRPVRPAVWLARISRAPAPDTIVVTSREAVNAGVRPWRRARGRLPSPLEVWAVGPETAKALRHSGVLRVYRPPTVGASALPSSLSREPPRTIVYLRSDVAGPGLARALRSQGHHVVDLVVYRLSSPPPLTPRARADLLRADLLVVTSPSGLSNLRGRLGAAAFARLARSVPLVVLGERSRRAARGQGFRRTSVAPAPTAQRFTRHLLRELRHARS